VNARPSLRIDLEVDSEIGDAVFRENLPSPVDEPRSQRGA